MRKQEQTTVEQVTDDLRAMLNTLKSVQGFRTHNSVSEATSTFVQHLQRGEDGEAVKAGQEAIAASRMVLGTFLRFSVTDRADKASFFGKEIAAREAKAYDQDLVARLNKRRKMLEEAVRVETNGVFTSRVEAYNTLMSALAEADAEQKRRDENRAQRQAEEKKAERERRDAETRERNRAAAAAQREAHLARRKAAAEEIMGLL